MSKTVTIKNGDFYYIIPIHEFTRYWQPHLDELPDPELERIIELEKIPSIIPRVSKLAGLKRGKGYKRMVKAYEQKGSGKHARTTN